MPIPPKKSAQYYVNHRWLGGTLTNWNTISASIKRLRKLEEMLAGNGAENFTKKERLMLSREHDKLELALGGIKDMGGVPDLMFVIDTNKEKNAVDEARRLKIPVVAILDTNCNPDPIDHPIPGNDDASRAIALYCDLIAKAALDGIARQQGRAGVDIGAMAEAPVEEVLAAAPAAPLFSAPAGEGDDLTKINGIGPVAKGQLNEQGIMTFAQIAALSDDDIARIDDAMPFSAAQITDWRAQAGELANA